MGDSDDDDDETVKHRIKRKRPPPHSTITSTRTKSAANNLTNNISAQEQDVQSRDNAGARTESGEELTLPRIFANCTAFTCVILIFIGELMNEQNLLAVLFIGSVLTVINILYTSVNLDRLYNKKEELPELQDKAGSSKRREENTVRFSDRFVTVQPKPIQQRNKTDRANEDDYNTDYESADDQLVHSSKQRRRLARKQLKRDRSSENVGPPTKGITHPRRTRNTGLPPAAIAVASPLQPRHVHNYGLPPGAVVIDMERHPSVRDSQLDPQRTRPPQHTRSKPKRPTKSKPDAPQADRLRKPSSSVISDKKTTGVRKRVIAKNSPSRTSTDPLVKTRSRPKHHPRGRRNDQARRGERAQELERGREAGLDRGLRKQKRMGHMQQRDERNVARVIEV